MSGTLVGAHLRAASRLAGCVVLVAALLGMAPAPPTAVPPPSDDAAASRVVPVADASDSGVETLLSTPVVDGRLIDGRLADRLLAALRLGLTIGLVAFGLSLIRATSGVVSLAHGELAALGAVSAWFLHAPANTGPGLSLFAAGAAAVAVSAAAGGVIELGLWRPLRRRRTGPARMLVAGFALMFVLASTIRLWLGERAPHTVGDALPRLLLIGPVRATPRDVAVVVLATVVLAAGLVVLHATRAGTTVRAVADDRDLAAASGIDVRRVLLLVGVSAAGLAGLGGVLVATTDGVDGRLGLRLLLLALAAMILGGATPAGTLVGALLVGLITELSSLWWPTEARLMWPLLALLVFLLLRPRGVLDQPDSGSRWA